MRDVDRNYIHYVAKQERALLRVERDDEIELTAQMGEMSGTVTSTVSPDIDEGKNAVIRLDPDDPLGENYHDVAIDYAGAFTSEYDYWVPYVVAGYDCTPLGEVHKLVINDETITAGPPNIDWEEDEEDSCQPA